jgi:hypothetical protein
VMHACVARAAVPLEEALIVVLVFSVLVPGRQR